MGSMMCCPEAEAHTLHVQPIRAPTDLTDRHDKTYNLTARLTNTDRQTDTHISLAAPVHCRAGTHLIVFLERGPFILVMASATGEPEAALTCRLGLVHAQILSILSSSVDKMFARNPSYDARKLLGLSLLMVVCFAVHLSVK